jgi:hypothetical protein
MADQESHAGPTGPGGRRPAAEVPAWPSFQNADPFAGQEGVAAGGGGSEPTAADRSQVVGAQAWPSYQNADPFAGQEGVATGDGFPGTGSVPPFQAPTAPQSAGFPPVPRAAGSFDLPVPQPAAGFAPGSPQPAAPSRPTGAAAAAATSYRIRLRMPDGKPFDGPEITTGLAESPGDKGGAARKDAPKVVVKSSAGAKVGHLLAVLVIAALGIVPLAYLMLGAVHKREGRLADTITVATKMNVIDGTSGAYLGGMAVVLLVAAFGYRSFLRRRRG